MPDSFDLETVKENSSDFILTFEVTSSDSNFINFTDTPIDELGYFNFQSQLDGSQENEAVGLSCIFQASSEVGEKVAVISLQLDHLGNDSSSHPINFSAQFKSRKTAWKYYIADKDNRFDNLRLEGKWSEYFTGPSETELPDISNKFQALVQVPIFFLLKKNRKLDLTF